MGWANMSRKPQKLTGRAIRDERGTSSWEWLTDTGTAIRELDTARLKTLSEGVSCSEGPGQSIPEFDPYNQSTSAQGEPTKPKRRSLDDMRCLNEQIKAAQKTAQDKK